MAACNESVVKEVQLNRTINEDSTLGSFGFSIMGGAGSKIPASICSVEPGGPADTNGKIKVGDQLVKLNGEDLTEVLPKDLVNMIRTAPTPSTFVLVEDPIVKEKIIAIIKKHEEKKRMREKKTSKASEKSLKIDEESASRKKHPSPLPSRSSTSSLSKKEIVIETSVNTNTGDVVTVRGGKIISTSSEPTAEEVVNSHAHPQKSATMSSVSSEQPSLLSSCSSGSLGGNDPPDDASVATITSSEVTSGGKVFVLKKQTSQESCDGSPSQLPVIRKTVIKKNGDIRASLTEEILANEINQQTALEMAGTNTDILNNKGSNSASLQKRFHPNDTSPDKTDVLPSSGTPTSVKYGKKTSRDDPFSQAILLARKMYMLDGFTKNEIGQKLADSTDFGRMVAREYLNFFEFKDEELVECLRNFLGSVSLTGETYDRERVIIHFSEKYFEQNPYAFPSYDAVHGVTCAILLLNSDLHSDHGGSKMTLNGFISNLERIDVRLPKESVKKMYDSIKKKALESPIDDGSKDEVNQLEEDVSTARVYHVPIPGTFVEVELPESAPVFKEGFMMRKNEMDGAHKKVPRGKRNWKPYYVHLKGFLMYFVPENGKLNLEDTSNALVVTHCLAMRAGDYFKRASVIRITTSDWHTFLLEANDINDLQEWISAFNKAAALFSAPPLAAPIGSGSGFQRPTFPIAPTKNSVEQQKESHDAQTKRIKEELEFHMKNKATATKSKKSVEWFEKYEFLQFELNRFHIYLGTLHSNAIMEYTGPLPSGLVPSPSISTLATTGTSETLDYRRSRESSPIPTYIRERKESSPVFPLNSTSRSKR